jgi:murein DD-endopeptidase MepM/ murein hydrolase activator NlpD
VTPPAAPETPDSGGATTPSSHGAGAFLWPVRGHVVATYGDKSDGSHNDGINIAAPRGTAVQAVDAGAVAYTGNELRGYGNLILVKHANGWISAYAHCDQVLVKRGDKVTRGQVIARVGSTGNVSEPQLHFELRRGQHAVDPREFLSPLPTATTGDSSLS